MSLAFLKQEDDELVFDNTKIILRRARDNQYSFYLRTRTRISSPSATDLQGLELTEIPCRSYLAGFPSWVHQGPALIWRRVG